jgi:hypothetical protein
MHWWNERQAVGRKDWILGFEDGDVPPQKLIGELDNMQLVMAIVAHCNLGYLHIFQSFGGIAFHQCANVPYSLESFPLQKYTPLETHETRR